MSFAYSFLPFMLDYQFSLEVGVRVEAYETGGQARHIQSAYITFISPDKDGNPEQLPTIARTTKVNMILCSKMDVLYEVSVLTLKHSCLFFLAFCLVSSYRKIFYFLHLCFASKILSKIKNKFFQKM